MIMELILRKFFKSECSLNLSVKPKINLYALILLGVLSQSWSADAPINLSNCSDLVISGKHFTSGSDGAAIKLTNCENVVIEDNSFELNSAVIGVQLQDSKNITIRYNTFRNFRSGVYAVSTDGGINIYCNEFYDIAGEKPRGQVVQFNKGSGGGNRVNHNILDHTFGIGYPEDLVNMYGTSGTESDPIQIIGNHFRGGGPSKSGGGIMVGDNGGKNIRVEDNILVDPGQYGIGSPAGENIKIRNNTVYAKQQSFTNVGIYVGLKSEIDEGFICDGPSIEVTGNTVNWKRKDGVQNDYYNYNGCPGVVKNNNLFRASIDESVLPENLSLNPQFCSRANSSSSQVSSSSSFSSSSAEPLNDPDIRLGLVDALNDQIVQQYTDIHSGDSICLDTLSTSEFTLEATVQSSQWTAGEDYTHIRFGWNGTIDYNTEGLAPYTLNGDDTEVDYYSAPLEMGHQNLVISLLNANAEVIHSTEFSFTTFSCATQTTIEANNRLNSMAKRQKFQVIIWDAQQRYSQMLMGKEIYSLQGEKLHHIEPDNTSFSMELPAGLYIVRDLPK